jgi:hypothetical protein
MLYCTADLLSLIWKVLCVIYYGQTLSMKMRHTSLLMRSTLRCVTAYAYLHESCKAFTVIPMSL